MRSSQLPTSLSCRAPLTSCRHISRKRQGDRPKVVWPSVPKKPTIHTASSASDLVEPPLYLVDVSIHSSKCHGHKLTSLKVSAFSSEILVHPKDLDPNQHTKGDPFFFLPKALRILAASTPGLHPCDFCTDSFSQIFNDPRVLGAFGFRNLGTPAPKACPGRLGGARRVGGLAIRAIAYSALLTLRSLKRGQVNMPDM